MRFLLLLLVACATNVIAQNGDKPGEEQAPPPEHMQIPPAPPLTVQEALKTFRLADGFSIEVVASDPLIEAPVEIEFAPDGSLYVLEMRGFMPNVEGRGEDQPIGRVSLLRDTDGDGRMDKATVFVEGLLMPRAICITHGGLLVAEPPNLWFFRDNDGDDKSDEKQLISNDYGNQKNPEHNANGLLWGRDNWVYSANHTVRYSDVSGEWEKQPTSLRGQWGISQDDYGRLFFNSNSDQFRGDLVPSEYFARNPRMERPFGLNVQIARDQSTFPVRVNPGVNRGYQKGTLRADGRLARFTGACGPLIYRGDLFPQKYYGAGFLCEPTANMVRCNFLREDNGMLTATNAFPSHEFLASTDERFRPVNLANGPDGALYVVDMYRGVIQHRIYLTTFLRNQALERGLETPLNYGRVYRVVPTGTRYRPPESLAKLSPAALVPKLAVTNGWTRDTAQRLLVERGGASAVPVLTEMAAAGRFPSAIHALWVLRALGDLNGAEAALSSSHPKVRATAIRVLEPVLRTEGSSAIKSRIMALTNDPSIDVRLQLMFSLGESKSDPAEAAMTSLLSENVDQPLLRDAAISGLFGREVEFLQRILARPSWNDKSPGRIDFVRELAECAAESRDPATIEHLLALAASRPEPWQQEAMLDGLAGLIPAQGRAKQAPKPKPIRFAAEPPALARLAAENEKGVQSRVKDLAPLLVWPGKPGYEEEKVIPLTESEQKLFDAGRAQYLIVCGACHQPNGLGLEGLAPPLVDSDWALGSPERLARIVLHGVRGPLNVKGRNWELEMPPLNILTDEELAGLMTYVRREWGHTASPISPELVAKVRKETEDRLEAWTEKELLKMP